MDFVNGNIRKIYFRYLAAAFGSAMITSVYSIVDMAMVGQYQGPDGTAAVIGSVVSFVVMLTHYFQAILQPKVSFVVSVYVALNIRKYTKALPEL